MHFTRWTYLKSPTPENRGVKRNLREQQINNFLNNAYNSRATQQKLFFHQTHFDHFPTLILPLGVILLFSDPRITPWGNMRVGKWSKFDYNPMGILSNTCYSPMVLFAKLYGTRESKKKNVLDTIIQKKSRNFFSRNKWTTMNAIVVIQKS